MKRFLFLILLAGLAGWLIYADSQREMSGVMCAKFLGWISDAVKGVTGLGTALWGGIKSGKERKKAAKALEQAGREVNQEQAWNDIWFNKEYYQDYMQRSEVQAALKALRDRLKRQSATDAQKAVMTGATPEAIAKDRELENDAYSNTLSAIAASSSNVKDRVMNRYLNYRQGLMGQKMGIYGQKMNLHNENARQWANLMGNGLNTLANSASSSGSGDNGLVNVISNLLGK